MTRQSLSRVPLLTVVQPFFCQPPEEIWPQRDCAAEVPWAGVVCQDLTPLSLKAQESGGGLWRGRREGKAALRAGSRRRGKIGLRAGSRRRGKIGLRVMGDIYDVGLWEGFGKRFGRVGFVGMISIDEMLELAMGRRCAENTGLYIF